MTDVYVDVGAASVDPATSSSADPEAIRALRYLAEAGVRIDAPVAARLDRGRRRVDVDPDHRTWLPSISPRHAPVA